MAFEMVETDITYDVAKDPAKVKEYDPGNPEHYFIVLLAHHVSFEHTISRERIDLDSENLVSIVGPYCFHCNLRSVDPNLTKRCAGPKE